jgi:serine/threonine-protein kinase
MTRERERRPENAAEAGRDFATLQATGALPAASRTPAPAAEPDPAASAFETAFSNAPPVPAVVPLRSAPTPASRTAVPGTQAPPRTPSGADSRAAWDSDVYGRVEEKLAARVGPLARLLVRNAAKETSDFEDLCRRLAEQIPDEGARPVFLREVLAGPASSRPSGAGSGPGTGPTPPPAPASHPSGPSSAGAFPPALLSAAEQKLAAEIGPLARVLVRREAKRQGTWSGFVEALVAQVPDESGRRRLRETLGPLGV